MFLIKRRMREHRMSLALHKIEIVGIRGKRIDKVFLVHLDDVKGYLTSPGTALIILIAYWRSVPSMRRPLMTTVESILLYGVEVSIERNPVRRLTCQEWSVFRDGQHSGSRRDTRQYQWMPFWLWLECSLPTYSRRNVGGSICTEKNWSSLKGSYHRDSREGWMRQVSIESQKSYWWRWYQLPAK